MKHPLKYLGLTIISLVLLTSCTLAQPSPTRDQLISTAIIAGMDALKEDNPSVHDQLCHFLVTGEPDPKTVNLILDKVKIDKDKKTAVKIILAALVAEMNQVTEPTKKYVQIVSTVCPMPL